MLNADLDLLIEAMATRDLTASLSAFSADAAAVAAKPYRLTGVFVREHGAWKLALWSGAEPVRSE
jgi:hypothetical protein